MQFVPNSIRIEIVSEMKRLHSGLLQSIHANLNSLIHSLFVIPSHSVGVGSVESGFAAAAAALWGVRVVGILVQVH